MTGPFGLRSTVGARKEVRHAEACPVVVAAPAVLCCFLPKTAQRQDGLPVAGSSSFSVGRTPCAVPRDKALRTLLFQELPCSRRLLHPGRCLLAASSSTSASAKCARALAPEGVREEARLTASRAISSPPRRGRRCARGAAPERCATRTARGRRTRVRPSQANPPNGPACVCPRCASSSRSRAGQPACWRRPRSPLASSASML